MQELRPLPIFDSIHRPAAPRSSKGQLWYHDSTSGNTEAPQPCKSSSSHFTLAYLPMSLPPSFKNEINALEREISKAQPKDVLQYCADFFNRRLASQRAEFHLAGNKSNGGMAETMSNPFGDKSPFGSSNKNVNSISEEDEERDSFGSPTDSTAKDTGRSPFGTASTFGAAAAGAAGGFGAAWAVGANTDQDQQAPGKSSHAISHTHPNTLPQPTTQLAAAVSPSPPNRCNPTPIAATGSLRNTTRLTTSSLASKPP